MFLLGTPIVRSKTLSISGYQLPSSYQTELSAAVAAALRLLVSR
jgi:hypothetical protein